MWPALVYTHWTGFISLSLWFCTLAPPRATLIGPSSKHPVITHTPSYNSHKIIPHNPQMLLPCIPLGPVPVKAVLLTAFKPTWEAFLWPSQAISLGLSPNHGLITLPGKPLAESEYSIGTNYILVFLHLLEEHQHVVPQLLDEPLCLWWLALNHIC